MIKHNLSAKKLKKQFLSLNQSLENYFNNLKYFFKNIKKTKISELAQNNRVFLALSAAVILTLSYFLLPTLYNKEIIQTEIKNQILKKYNIDINFNEQIKYGLLPKPHFSVSNLSIVRGQDEIALSKNFKFFIAVEKFFSFNKVIVKDLIFKKVDFNIQKNDFIFFKTLMQNEPNENDIVIKNSNIFFKSKNDEVLFINKIFKSKFHYDSNNLVNIFSSNNEIFNIPYTLIIKNDKFNKKVFIKFNSKKIRLVVENEINYDDLFKSGILEFIFVNKGTALNYIFKKNSLDFNSKSKKNNYEGSIFFKPFYFTSKFNYSGLSTKNLFNNDSVIAELVKSKILNNKNLNANIILNIKDITNIDELNNLNLNIEIEEGNIGFSNSVIKWKDDMEIKLYESILNFDENEINLIGRVSINFIDLDNFYKSFQIKKNYRKNIDNIEIDFVYNLDKKKITFDNVKINNKFNSDLENYIDNFNNDENRVLNRITFKNFINNFFGTYAG